MYFGKPLSSPISAQHLRKRMSLPHLTDGQVIVPWSWGWDDLLSGWVYVESLGLRVETLKSLRNRHQFNFLVDVVLSWTGDSYLFGHFIPQDQLFKVIIHKIYEPFAVIWQYMKYILKRNRVYCWIRYFTYSLCSISSLYIHVDWSGR